MGRGAAVKGPQCEWWLASTLNGHGVNGKKRLVKRH